MNFIRHRISESSLAVEVRPKRNLKYILSSALSALVIISSIFIYLGKKETTLAFNLGFGYDFQEVLTLNNNSKISNNTVPLPLASIDTSQTGGDKRVIALLIFLESYKSPMATASVAKAVIENADKHGLGDNWPLIIAIAGIESGFGKLIPYTENQSSYNAWGWTCVGSDCFSRWRYFNSWEHGVETLTNGLVTGYGGPENLSPAAIMPRYCPDCAEGGGAWAIHVSKYIEDIRAVYNTL